jgi:hypothetical protein
MIFQTRLNEVTRWAPSGDFSKRNSFFAKSPLTLLINYSILNILYPCVILCDEKVFISL